MMDKNKKRFPSGSHNHLNTKNLWIYLTIVILVASFLRVYQLKDVPGGFFADEAINAYDSFSILKTGRNIWGETLPLFFNHHNVDTVSGIYIYSSIPFIHLLGLNEFSARLTAAVYGILTVLFTYIFVNSLFRNNKIALLASFLLAVSPWHIMFSRLSMRGIILPFFFILAVYFLLKGHRQIKYSILSGLTVGVCFYTYSVVKLFLPLFLIGYAYIYRKELYKHNKNFAIFLILVLLITLPALRFSLSDSGMHRFKDLSVFSPSNVEPVRESLGSSSSLKKQLVHLPDIGISGLIFAKNYLTFYSPKFLFSKNSGGSVNLLHWFEFPFILLGLFFLCRYRHRSHMIILWWFIIFSVPSSLTVPGTVPHRAINALPVFQIIAAFGIYHAFKLPVFQRRERLLALTSILLVLSLLNIGVSLYNYFMVYPKVSGEHLQYGFREAISYTESVKGDYDEITFSHNLHNAYALLLFYTKYDPERYLSNPEMKVLKTPQNIWLNLREIDKYRIKVIDKEYTPDPRVLYVVTPWELEDIKPRKIIYYMDGTPAIKII